MEDNVYQKSAYSAVEKHCIVNRPVLVAIKKVNRDSYWQD